jgi:hypothetical protein
MTINYNDGGIREQIRKDLRGVYGNREIDTMERLVRADIIRGLPTSKEFAKGETVPSELTLRVQKSFIEDTHRVGNHYNIPPEDIQMIYDTLKPDVTKAWQKLLVRLVD